MSDDGDYNDWDEGEERDDDAYDDEEPELEIDSEPGSEGDNESQDGEFHILQQTHEQSKPKKQGVRGKETKKIADDKRITTPFMTKYERVRLLSLRAAQISRGTMLLVSPEGESDPLQIASREMEQGRIPMVVRRYLPDGCYEDWRACELGLCMFGWPVEPRWENL